MVQTDHVTHKRRAFLLLRRIPRGKVVTYKELARASGTSPRAVGRILAGNKEPEQYPCYRVVSSLGGLTGYSAPGGLARKRELLERDGITLTPDGRVRPEFFYIMRIVITNRAASCDGIRIKNRKPLAKFRERNSTRG